MKIRRLICDLKDAAYQEKLTEFLMTHYEDVFLVQAIDSEKEEEEDDLPALLTDKQYGEEEKEELKTRFFPILWMNDGEELDPYQSGHGIAKALFKAILREEKMRETELIRQQMEDHAEKSPGWMSGTAAQIEATGEGEQKPLGNMRTVVSSRGGIGASTLARFLAEEYSAYGRTLLVDISGPSWWGDVFSVDSENGGLSDLMMSFLAEPKEIMEERLESWVERQSAGFFYIRPVRDAEDLWALTEEESVCFWNVIRDHFDYVILDEGKVWTKLGNNLPKEAEYCLLHPGEKTGEEEALCAGRKANQCWMFEAETGSSEGRGRSSELVDTLLNHGKKEETVFVLPDLRASEGQTGNGKGKMEWNFRKTEPETGDASSIEEYKRVIREAVKRMG